MTTKSKAAVTGADGFIGSHLTELLLREGYEVRALVQYNSFGFRGNLEGISHPDLEVVAGDVRDPGFCREFTRGADLVFHLAALIAIPYSYVAPDSYVQTNVGGTLNMLQAARANANGRLLVTSTSEVYGTAQTVPIPESHPKQPQSPYSASKIGADALALSFHAAFDLPVCVARPFNTYGPRQSARAFIPTVISQIASGQRRIKVGDLTPTRDFNYVEDTCRGLLAVALSPQAVGRETNIATGTEISMADTLRTLASIMGADVEWETDPARLRPSASEVRRLCGDSTRLRETTGWMPRLSLEEGLRRTAAWFSDPERLRALRPGEYML